MQLHELVITREAPKSRVGRGIGAGQGKTAGRGTKGQKARTGYKIPRRFAGMMSASDYRMAKVRGFKSHRDPEAMISLDLLERGYQTGETVTPDNLVERGLIKGYGRSGVKLVNRGALTKELKLDQIKVSASLSSRFNQPAV